MHILTTGNLPRYIGDNVLIWNLESSKLILGPTKLLKLPDCFCSPKMKKVSMSYWLY